MVLISEIHRIYVNVYLIIFPREEISVCSSVYLAVYLGRFLNAVSNTVLPFHYTGGKSGMLARSTAPLRADLPVFQVSQSQGLVQNQLVLVGIFSDGGWERGLKHTFCIIS